MKVTAQMVKALREETGAGLMEVKKALDEAKGDNTKAKEILKKKGLEKLSKREGNEASEGVVYAYVHQNRVGGMVKIACETDFVAKSEEFTTLGKELAMQVASMNPKNIKELLAQDYIRDPKRKVQDLVDEVAVKVKEKVAVAEMVRLAI